MVCCGPEFSGTFHKCKFKKCTLYAVHGAAVTLRGCDFHQSNPGAVAHGPATSLSLQSCAFSACMTSITAEAGASVNAVDCSSAHPKVDRRTRNSGSTIVVHSGASVTCTGCAFEGSMLAQGNSGGTLVPASTGVHATDARAELRVCTLKCFRVGVCSIGRTSAVELHACQMSAVVLAGVITHGRGVLLLRDSWIQQWRLPRRLSGAHMHKQASLLKLQATEVEGEGLGGQAQVERCTLEADSAQSPGMQVIRGAALSLTLSHVSCKLACVSVCDSSRATAAYSMLGLSGQQPMLRPQSRL